jgi:hypothetical protein
VVLDTRAFDAEDLDLRQMKRTTFLKLGAVLIAAAFAFAPRPASAVLLIDNVSISETLVRFDVAGTLDLIGPNNPYVMYFGFADDREWFSAASAFGSDLSKHGGDFAPTGGAGVQHQQFGSYLYLFGRGGADVGSEVDVSVAYRGKFDVSSFDAPAFKVQMGYDRADPDPLIQTNWIAGGTAAAPVPLPASGLMLLAGLAGLAVMRRRR